MFRRRAPHGVPIDKRALAANCQSVIAELRDDFDWRLPDPHLFTRRITDRCAELLAAATPAAVTDTALRRLIEREACAEYFADLYDALTRGGLERQRALTELFRPEEVEAGSGIQVAYRGYLYRAALYYLQRWTGRNGWNPAQEECQELARATAEEALMVVLRRIDLHEGRRAFWSYLSTAVERRAIDQLRALDRHQATESLDALAERRGDAESGLFHSPRHDPERQVTDLEALRQTMDAARLGQEERYALVAGAYGLDDREAAADLSQRLARAIGAADIRRWRFRARDKLRRVSEAAGSLK